MNAWHHRHEIQVPAQRYWIRPERLAISSRLAKLIKSQRFMTLWRLYVYETLLERLPQHFEHIASELDEFIEVENTVVRQRPLRPQRHLASSDQSHLRDRWVRGATWAHEHGCGGIREDPR
jgi:hypothetical protein